MTEPLNNISAGGNGHKKNTSTNLDVTRVLKDGAISMETNYKARTGLISTANKLLGIKYEFGAEWANYAELPETLDCSEMIEGIFKINKLDIPDGSQNQYNFTISTNAPIIGDLAFFGRGKDNSKVYHVGMVYDDKYIIEARAYQPEASFPTGKVILRDRSAWENYKNFLGYRTHPKLLLA